MAKERDRTGTVCHQPSKHFSVNGLLRVLETVHVLLIGPVLSNVLVIICFYRCTR